MFNNKKRQVSIPLHPKGWSSLETSYMEYSIFNQSVADKLAVFRAKRDAIIEEEKRVMAEGREEMKLTKPGTKCIIYVRIYNNGEYIEKARLAYLVGWNCFGGQYCPVFHAVNKDGGMSHVTAHRFGEEVIGFEDASDMQDVGKVIREADKKQKNEKVKQ